MSFPRYARYKDSGVDWLGKVPEHWSVERLKYSITKIEQGWSPQCDNEPALDGEWGVLKVGCGNGNAFDPTEQKALPSDLTPVAEYEIKPGDILMSRGNTRELVGMATLVKKVRPRLLLCDLLYRFQARPERVESEYLVFSLRSANVRLQIEREASGTSSSMKKIGQGTIREFIICLPPLHEQRAIVASLNAETAKIDALVDEQRRLIELLKEKRQAVVSHAVTKGLNPHAPMKPSGIEWLGDVPEHWEVERLKYSITKIEQGWSPQCDSEPAADGEWGILKVGCGNGDDFDPAEQKALPLELVPMPEYEIKSGDILMSRGNTRELVGMATLVKQVRPRLLLCDLLYRFQARNERVESEYLVFSLRSANTRFQIEREASGTSANMKKIGQGTIRGFIICLPPLDEQRAISTSIKAETAKLEALTAEAQRAIDLLQERRTALISAAVNGKIDVRDLAESEAP
jgi:type I restriction enzyme S subunit